ncbi:nicotinic acid mononucleotide adenyltransferase [uncultured Maribacter sp.]|uniref:toxin-antitoxin system YwqK family antitoxin n=1 Tax=uncultured Maribacter sp. TaxID=431308 RepID=UPI00262C2ACF|nr:nicotinic acid mononucleotide adenyltransferase [uncultured Maribacter sp.]
MKRVILILALIASVGMYAQETNPTYEVEGEMVKATYYHENGKIAQTGFFVNEKLQGEWKMYNEEGRKIAMGQYNNGVKTGKWFFWKGEKLNEVDFDQNKIAHVIQWSNAEAVVLNK